MTELEHSTAATPEGATQTMDGSAAQPSERSVGESGGQATIQHYQVVKDQGFVPESRKKEMIRSVLYLFLSTIIYVVNFHYFVAPSKFAPGGIGGVVAIVKHVFHVSGSTNGIDFSSLLFVLVNVALLALFYRHLTRDFLWKTLAEAALMTGLLFVLDNFIDPAYRFSIAWDAEAGALNTNPDTGLRLIAAIFGGVFCGLCLQFALRVNASTGGTDIIAVVLQQKNPGKSVPVMIFLVNSAVVLVSAFIYKDNLMPVFLSLIYMFVSTKTSDAMMCGIKSAMKFVVISEYGEQISREVIERMGHGVTATPAKGMFEGHEKTMLICVIQPRQIVQFKRIIEKYPNTFAYIETVNEIVGKFNHPRTHKEK